MTCSPHVTGGCPQSTGLHAEVTWKRGRRQATPSRVPQFSNNNGRHFLGPFHGPDTVLSTSPRFSLLIPSVALRVGSVTIPSFADRETEAGSN